MISPPAVTKPATATACHTPAASMWLWQLPGCVDDEIPGHVASSLYAETSDARAPRPTRPRASGATEETASTIPTARCVRPAVDTVSTRGPGTEVITTGAGGG